MVCSRQGCPTPGGEAAAAVSAAIYAAISAATAASGLRDRFCGPACRQLTIWGHGSPNSKHAVGPRGTPFAQLHVGSWRSGVRDRRTADMQLAPGGPRLPNCMSAVDDLGSRIA